MEKVKELDSEKFFTVGKKPIKVVEHYGSKDFDELLETFFKYIFKEDELWDLKSK